MSFVRNVTNIYNTILTMRKAWVEILNSNNSKNKELSILYKCLYWIGLLKESDKSIRSRITTILFFTCFLAVVLDKWIYSILYYYEHKFIETISYLMCYFFSVLVWYAMRCKRKQLSILLSNMKKLSLCLKFTNVKGFMYVIFLVPVTCSISMAFGRRSVLVYQLFYGYKIENFYMQVIIITIKIFLISLAFPTFINFIALFFCIQCHQFCILIRSLTNEINACPPMNFTISKQLKILQKESEIDDILEVLREYFSAVSLLVFGAYFLCSVSTLGYFVTTAYHTLDISIGLVLTLYAACSLAGMMSMLYVAGGLSIELNSFKKAFCKKLQHRMIFKQRNGEIESERGMLEKPEFELSACGILNYKRSNMLTLVGALLTYTIILFNSKDWS